MNITVVPFFLAASLVVDNTSNWRFGPEYLYNMTINCDVKMDLIANYTIINMNRNSTVQCRPKDPETLFCRLNNISSVINKLGDGISIRKDMDSENLFEIKFNEHGVETVLVESDDINIVNIIRKIAAQFSTNVNLMDKNNARSKMQLIDKEKTPMGRCMTTYAIKHEEHQPNTTRKKNYQFKILSTSMTEMESRTSLSISKTRKQCTDGPNKLDIITIFRMERYNSIIWIDDVYRTFTEINGYIQFETDSIMNETFFYKETIELNLDSIKPAQDKLPSFNGHVIDLIIKNDNESRIL